jgi:hypothetical protein
MCTSPSGKSYIGQTKYTFKKRIDKHLQRSAANDFKPQCWAFNAALRLYEWKSWKHEILIICDNEMMNYYECKFIDMYNTIAPKGYNLTPGGEGNSSKRSQDTKDKLSLSKRKYDTFTTTTNVTEVNYESEGRIEHGFRVIHEGKTYNFISTSMSMEEKLYEAIECCNIIKSGGTYEIKNKFKRNKHDTLQVPMYVVKRGNNGFAFNFPGLSRKTFDFVQNTRRQNLIAALKYYIKTVDFDSYEDIYTIASNLLDGYEIQEDEEKVQRLNGSGLDNI